MSGDPGNFVLSDEARLGTCVGMDSSTAHNRPTSIRAGASGEYISDFRAVF